MKRFAKQHNTDLNQPEIVKALQDIGCVVWDIGRPVDLLVEVKGIFIVLEVKNTKGFNRLTNWQKDFFTTTNGPAYIVRDPLEAVNAVNLAVRQFQSSE